MVIPPVRRNRNRSPLDIPELFDLVLACLEEPDSYDDDNRLVMVQPPLRTGQCALAALAQTCRAFSEPSLNSLWRKLRSLTPLLLCFIDADDVDTVRQDSVSSPFFEPKSCLDLDVNRRNHHIKPSGASSTVTLIVSRNLKSRMTPPSSCWNVRSSSPTSCPI